MLKYKKTLVDSCRFGLPAPASGPHLPAPLPAARCRLARLGCGEGDALRVQVVGQLGGAQADPRRLESGLEGGEDHRPVAQDLGVELRVGQDEVSHCLEAVLQAGSRLGGRHAHVGIRVAVGGEGRADLRVGPENRGNRERN